MAEALLRTISNGSYETFSAGTEAHGLNSMAIDVMQEIGIDISQQKSERFTQYCHKSFEHVITVCDSARESCPIFSVESQYHWAFEDPALATGSRNERMAVFRRVRDEIAAQIQQFVDGFIDSVSYTHLRAHETDS